MKRKNIFLYVLTFIFTCLMSTTLLTACEEEHVHSYTQEVTKEATCENGIMTYTCPCGDTYTEDVAAVSEHDWESSYLIEVPFVDKFCYSVACK